MWAMGMSNDYLCTYDLYGPVRNAFDAGSIHYLGPRFQGPKIEISRAQPPPTFPSIDAGRIKSITQGAV